jgi:negative elongation factor B
VIYSADECHNIAWCLDACIRDDKVDVRQIAELRTYAVSLELGDSVIGDLAMIVTNPLAVNVLTKALYSSLQACIEAHSLPSVGVSD